MTGPRLRLFLASFLVLYFELVFIRWVPGQVRILGYYTNFVLIACFLGMGLGMILARSRRDLAPWTAAALVGVVALAILFKGVWVLPHIEDSLFLEYEGTGGFQVALYPVLILFYVAIAAAFIPLGQLVGRCFGDRSPLTDYSVNLLGSMAGIVVFFLYSWLALPAWMWFALGAPLLCLVVPIRSRALTGALALGMTLMTWSVDQGTIWSPYHKIDITPFGIDRKTGELMPMYHGQEGVDYLPPEVGFNLRVNNDFYQFPVNLSDEVVAKYPGLKAMQSQYDLPYRLKPNARRVLIVGGGSGNDAAATLRHGAQHIDVVDIDPEIVAIGRRSHPEKPYDQTDRVFVHIDDARHFFHHAEPGYDVIVFALLDSHRLMSNMSSLRLDSYVFTVESFGEAKRLLNPDGIQVTAFAIGEPWMQSRFYEMLRQVYGSEPIIAREQGLPTSAGVVYISSPAGSPAGMKVRPRSVDVAAVLPSDDWPFVYARARLIPLEYLIALALVVLISTVAVRLATGISPSPSGTPGVGEGRGEGGAIGAYSLPPHPRPLSPEYGGRPIGLPLQVHVSAHFFCLGAGFLLLETKNVTTLALAFGSTWYVNSVVFFSVLAMALLSAWLMSRWERFPVGGAYAGLFLAIALNGLVPLREFVGASLGVRLVLVGGLTALPVFFSGIVFAHSFKRAADPAAALGANVLGGVLGGVMEYLSMLMGLRFLFFLIAGFYALSLLALLRFHLAREAAIPLHVPLSAESRKERAGL